MHFTYAPPRCNTCQDTYVTCGKVSGLCQRCSEEAVADWQRLQTPWRMALAGWLRTLADRLDGGPSPESWAWR